jgi:hypothetical protein
VTGLLLGGGDPDPILLAGPGLARLPSLPFLALAAMDGALRKDFLALFPQDGGDGNANPDHDLGGYHQHQHQQQQQQQQQQQLNLDMLLMGAPPLPDGAGPSGSQAHEQQVKLARLKLLQVQHEILQQQASPAPRCSARTRADARWPSSI